MVLDGTLSCQELLLLRRRLSLEHPCDEIRLRGIFLKPDVIFARFTLPLQEALVLEQATALRQLLVLPWATLLALEHVQRVCVRVLVVTLRDGRKTLAVHHRILLTAEAGGVRITGVNGAI